MTAAHVVNDTDGASTVSGLSVFTGGPSNNFVSNPAYTFHGIEISVDMENVYSNGIPNPGNLTEDYISKDVAVMNLTERARFGNTLLGWLSLIPSAEFVESGSSGTIYGYPYNANGTSGQAQTTASLEGPYAPNGGSGETAYYVSETATEPGESGGAVVLEFSVAEGAPETYGVVGVNSAASEDEGYFAALTDMTVGMIEYWRSLGGNSLIASLIYVPFRTRT